jgi:beta-glucosidase
MIDPEAAVAALSLLEKAALLSGRNVWQTREIPRLGIPSIWMADGPHGLRRQPGDADHLGIGESEPAVCYPTAATIANSWDEALAEEIGVALGRDAAAKDVHVLLGPGLNIKRSPLGGRNFEYFSEDPELSGRLAAAYVRGTQSVGVAATPKHFAVNSQELRRMASDSVVDERTLREIYLTAFEIVVREASPWAIMTSYNLVNGDYAQENAHLLQQILRTEWGFDGAVISDWGGTNEAVASVAAGGTIEMPSAGFGSVREIVAAVGAGELAEADVDARVVELLRLVARTTSERREAPKPDEEASHALARRAAAAGAVLLHNEDGILPLAPGTGIALIGAFASEPRYQGAGSSLVNATRLTTLLGSVEASGLDLVAHAPGFRLDGAEDFALLAAAVDAAAGADVVVLALGLPAAVESEGLDRTALELPRNQLELLEAVAATGTPIVVVLSGGGAVTTEWLDRTAAVLHGYLGGQAGAEAIWDVLTGAVEPGGRLAETIPRRLADTPTAARFPSLGRTAEYREGVYVGYRYYASAGVVPAFPFGFGLGYTTFAYRDLEISPAGVRFVMENTGARAGSDVAQLYVRRLGPSAVARPALELRGFAKVRLEPGEQRVVEIALTDRAFRHFDVATGSWQVEAGEFEILVGPQSSELPLRGRVTLAGTVPAGILPEALAPYGRAEVLDVSDEAFSALLGRTIPEHEWHAPPYGINTPLDRLEDARSRTGRLIFRILHRLRRRADASAHPSLEVLMVYTAPFRLLHKLTSGLFGRRFTEALLDLVNGKFWRGIAGMIRGWAGGRMADRRTRRELERATSGAPALERRSG